MAKKALFIGMVILVVSSAASAAPWSNLWSIVMPWFAPPGG